MVRKEQRTETLTGTIRKLGLEGGVWALITDQGASIELLDPPDELKTDGVKARVTLSRDGAQVSIGMVGDVAAVTAFELL